MSELEVLTLRKEKCWKINSAMMTGVKFWYL